MTSVAVLRGKQREWLVGVWAASLVLLLIVLAIGLVAVVYERDEATAEIGAIDQFAPGSVTLVQLDASLPQAAREQLAQTTRWLRLFTAPIPVYLVHDNDGAWYAFYQADPRNSCTIAWQPAEKLFIDPCHGSAYTSQGEYVRGPSKRNLHSFRVDIRDTGLITIDPRSFQPGAPAQ